MISAPTQRKFDLAIASGRPLLPLEAVMVALDCDEDAALTKIELGLLRWAFRIECQGAKRMELRVFSDCVRDYQPIEGAPDYKKLNEKRTAADLAKTINCILPKVGIKRTQQGDAIRLTALARRFTCSASHVTNLVKEGSLVRATVPVASHESALILRESVVAFLGGRVEPKILQEERNQKPKGPQ